jgi:hypothetical protein
MPYSVLTRNQAMGVGKNSVSLQARIARCLYMRISNKANGEVTSLVRDSLESLEESGMYIAPWVRREYSEWFEANEKWHWRKGWNDCCEDMRKELFPKFARDAVERMSAIREQDLLIFSEYVPDNVLAQVRERLYCSSLPSDDTESSSA